jgi:hypothetical protein
VFQPTAAAQSFFSRPLIVPHHFMTFPFLLFYQMFPRLLPITHSPEPYRGLLLNTQFPTLGCSAYLYTRTNPLVPGHVVVPRKTPFRLSRALLLSGPLPQRNLLDSSSSFIVSRWVISEFGSPQIITYNSARQFRAHCGGYISRGRQI